jgi:hypothetical protein
MLQGFNFYAIAGNVSEKVTFCRNILNIFEATITNSKKTSINFQRGSVLKISALFKSFRRFPSAYVVTHRTIYILSRKLLLGLFCIRTYGI